MCNSNSTNPMAIQLAPLVGAGLGALQQSKIEKALAGEKTYTKPKTIFGKLIGGVSGRTAAAEASAATKTSPLSDNVLNSFAGQASPSNNMNRQSTPITGGFSLGGEATKKTYLPFAIVAAVIAAFYFLRKKGGRRRGTCGLHGRVPRQSRRLQRRVLPTPPAGAVTVSAGAQ
jgi:hypothetical protein